jgi:hypothetical protein
MAKKLSRYLPGLSLDATPKAPTKAVKQQKRNGHAFHPIMAKGGVHEKSKSAQRAAAKQQTNRKAREWLGRSLIISIAITLGCQSNAAQNPNNSNEANTGSPGQRFKTNLH